MHSKELHNAVVDSLVFVICRQDRIPDNPSRSVLGGMCGPAGQNLVSVQTFFNKDGSLGSGLFDTFHSLKYF